MPDVRLDGVCAPVPGPPAAGKRDAAATLDPPTAEAFGGSRRSRATDVRAGAAFRALVAAGVALAAPLGVVARAHAQEAPIAEGGSPPSQTPQRRQTWSDRLELSTPDGAFSIGPSGSIHFDAASVFGPRFTHDDAQSSNDLLFLERPAAADAAAPIAFIGCRGNGRRKNNPVAIRNAPDPVSTPPGAKPATTMAPSMIGKSVPTSAEAPPTSLATELQEGQGDHRHQGVVVQPVP